jgi:hypothetical protein
MLLTMFGVPTALTARGVQIIRALASVILGNADFIAAGSVEELRAAWGKLSTRNVIFYHESPTGEITSFFRKSAAPMLIFVDDPVEVAFALVRERGAGILDAMRATSLCFSALEEVAVSKQALVLDACSDLDLSFRALLQIVCRHFDLPFSDLLVMAIMKSLRQDGAIASDTISDDPWSAGVIRGSEPAAVGDQLETVETCLAPYREIQGRKRVRGVTWPPSAFMSMDQGGKPAVGMFDMTGKRRIFFYGPYLGLPPGRWVARIDFEVANNRMGCVMQVNAISKDFLTQGRVQLPEAGRHSCIIPFETVEPKWPVEIHFTLDQGVLEGQFGLLNVDIVRQGDVR